MFNCEQVSIIYARILNVDQWLRLVAESPRVQAGIEELERFANA